MKFSKLDFTKSNSRRRFERVPLSCRSGSTTIVLMLSMLISFIVIYGAYTYSNMKDVAKAEEELFKTAEEISTVPIRLDSTNRERTHVALDLRLGNLLYQAISSGNPAVQKEERSKLQSFLERNVIGQKFAWEFEVTELGSKKISTGFFSSKKVDFARVFVPKLYNTWPAEGQVFEFVRGEDIPESVYKKIRKGDKILVQSEIVKAYYGVSLKSCIVYSAPFGTDKDDLSPKAIGVLNALTSELDVREEGGWFLFDYIPCEFTLGSFVEPLKIIHQNHSVSIVSE